jgi:hypothetical protein
MSWAAVIVGGATLVGAAASSRSTGRAADAQGRASQDAIAAQQESERRALEMQEPFYEAGYAATAAMMDMTGLDRSGLGASARVSSARDRGVVMGDTLLPEGTTSDSPSNKRGSNIYYNGQRIGHVVPGGPNGRFVNDTGFDVDGTFRSLAGNATAAASPADLSSYDKYDWKTDPGYQARLEEGLRVRERSASARGVLNSGGTLRGVERYAQDYASNEYQRVFDRISTIAGRGQSAASQGSQTIVNTGQGVGNALINAGEARASGYVAQGNAWSNAATQGAQLYGYYNNNRVPPSPLGSDGPGAWGTRGSVPGTMNIGGGYQVNY